MKVSVVIPAHNEQERIVDVLEVVVGCPKINEVIVVDDGSEDDTFMVANTFSRVKVERFRKNKGKACAMNRGVKLTNNPNILFLDADLKGLGEEHIEKMINEYEKGYEMVIGIFHKGRLSTDFSQKFISSHLSGQRLLSKEIWDSLDLDIEQGYGVEATLSGMDLNSKKVRLEGVTHIKKEEKRGFVQGIKERIEMYYQVTKTYLSRFLSYLK
ncbi:MAG: glycosyltransferase family 2 protein [Candidatus Paceibacterota bacterium]